MFPFDQPWPTAFYLVFYLGTLVLHVAPMNYVLAGSTYLAILGVWEAVGGKRLESHAPIAGALRDWMPLALSVAITAGVAPLLFIQILYKEPFYTANLLLFHRWMLILPVLIVAFYLLYLQKLKRLGEGRGWLRMAIALGVMGCFGFVAWSWTENHLLSTRDQQIWIEQYASGGFFYGDSELPPRLSLWFLGAFPTLATILAWQIGNTPESQKAQRPLAVIALSTLGASALAAVIYAATLPADTRSLVLSAGVPYLLLAAAGAAAQSYAWVQVWRKGIASTYLLGIAAAGALASTVGMTVARELRRLAAIDIAQYYDAHAASARVGGLAVFLIFFLLNAALIAGVLWLVNASSASKGRTSAADDSTDR